MSVIVGGPWGRVVRRDSMTWKFCDALKLKLAKLSHYVKERIETKGVSDEFVEGVN